jgi:hypothetical protein
LGLNWSSKAAWSARLASTELTSNGKSLIPYRETGARGVLFHNILDGCLKT